MLSDIAIRALKPDVKAFKRADSLGLFLLVEPHGAKLWRFKYRFAGSEKLLSGGRYPAVGLTAARKWRDECREHLDQGRDPSMVRQQERRRVAAAAENTFETVGREWYAGRKVQWAARYGALVLSRLEADIFPVVGHMPVSAVDGPTLLDALRKIEKRGALEMAHRVRNHCGEIFRYAVAAGLATGDPSRDIGAALKRPPPKKNRARLRADQMPEFFTRMKSDTSDELTLLAIRWTLLTMVRSQETRFAVWEEFEGLGGKEPLWRIPKERMKARVEHLIPLSRQAVAMLGRLRERAGRSKWVFPVGYAWKNEVISENRMSDAMRRWGYRELATVHGFRATASTTLNESGLWSVDAIELALAHQEQNDVRAAYNAAKLLPERRRMLQWWADLLDTWEAGSVDPAMAALG